MRLTEKDLLVCTPPPSGHFNGPRYWINGIAGRVRAINTITSDLKTDEGRKNARRQFLSAVNWAKDNGAKVILLAASTKRFFGEDGAELKKLFPEIVFTIGDNVTMLILKNEVMRALKEAKLSPSNILGPYGLLGERMVEVLQKEGYNIVGAGPNVSGLKRIGDKYQIKICKSVEEMGKVDAVVACTHSDKVCLTAENIESIRFRDKKLLVIDVSEPSNLKYREYQSCREVVIRQDAGNAYSKKLKYVLGAVTYKTFRLTRGVTFGCFAEAISLVSALKKNSKIKDIDWFSVNETNMNLVAEIFKDNCFDLPSARCFGEPVESFDLSVNRLYVPNNSLEEKRDKKDAFILDCRQTSR